MKAKGTKIKILASYYSPDNLAECVEGFIHGLPDNADVDVKYMETVSQADSVLYSAMIMYNINEDEI